jgi:RNA polymerase sigma-70 factor, ECF subfamily
MTETKNNKDTEDISLIYTFLAGDRSAFNKLVLKYKDLVFNLCFRLLGDYDEANDCAQETFIKVFKNLNKFKFKSGFSTWLYRIAVNTCKNELSSLGYKIKKKSMSLDSTGDCISREYGERKIDVSDNLYNPALIYEKKERGSIIQKAIESLKSNEKILVVLCDIEGKSYDEIADITGINIGTVKSRLARARQGLRDKLRGVF